MRGGVLLGGKQGLRDTFVGETTRYVVNKAHCRVLLTAPPAEGQDPTLASDVRAERAGRPHSRPLRLNESSTRIAAMFVLVVGAGRVGSSVATTALRAGHTVSVLDEDPLSHERLDVELGQSWEEAGGRFTIGTALELDALVEAGIEQAQVFIASTNGDNTNLVVAQIAQRRFEVPRVIARVLDPRRAAWYAEQGVQTLCPTADRDRAARAGRAVAPTGSARPASAHGRVRDHRRRGQGRLEPGAGADREGPRGDRARAGPAPLPDRRAGARARGPVRRRDRAVGARARGHPARRPRRGRHRRRRGQPADLPGREGEVPRASGSSPASTTRGTSSTSS